MIHVNTIFLTSKSLFYLHSIYWRNPQWTLKFVFKLLDDLFNVKIKLHVLKRISCIFFKIENIFINFYHTVEIIYELI